jgi:nitrate/TMAO reductase-like tetraheme cytochrome c subunit
VDWLAVCALVWYTWSLIKIKEQETATMAFTDIKIVGINENASTRSAGSNLFNVVLTLSSSAPWEWSQHFNQRWQQEFYMMKRDASASGNQITITCVPAELETDHLQRLNAVAEATNAAYSGYIAQKEAANAASQKKDAEDKGLLSQLGAKLFK